MIKSNPINRNFYIPKVHVYLESRDYVLYSNGNHLDLEESFQLRYEAFIGESLREEKDWDFFDNQCDFLFIRDKKTNMLVATARLISSLFYQNHYTSKEFDLSFLFERLQGPKLEIGRVCVKDGHRNGSVIDLLWKGIGDYCKKTNSRYLFGCASYWFENENEVHEINGYLKENSYFLDSYFAEVRDQYYFKYNILTCTERMKNKIPPLLKMYLSAGAKVIAKPAYDKEFNCVDYLVLMDLNNLKDHFYRRYFKDKQTSKLIVF